MVYIQSKDHAAYRYAFYLDPEIETADIEWRIMRGETIIDEGVLED